MAIPLWYRIPEAGLREALPMPSPLHPQTSRGGRLSTANQLEGLLVGPVRFHHALSRLTSSLKGEGRLGFRHLWSGGCAGQTPRVPEASEAVGWARGRCLG